MPQKLDLTNVKRGLTLVKMLNFDPESKRGPLRIAISPTSACNYRCVFCGSHSYLTPETNAKLENMNFDILDLALMQARDMGTDNILWCGNGEPTLSNPMIEFINRNEYGYKNDILTNGSQLDRIDRTTFSHISVLRISLNSGNGKSHQITHHYKGENQFPHIVKNISRLMAYPDAQRKISINYVITNDNKDELEDLDKMCGAWGVEYHARPIDATNPEFEHLKLDGIDPAKILRACYVGFIQCYIPTNGDVLICCGLIKSPLGNIYTENFKDIWVRSRSIRMRAAAMDITNKPIARGCVGCANALASSASFHRYYSKIPMLSRWKGKL